MSRPDLPAGAAAALYSGPPAHPSAATAPRRSRGGALYPLFWRWHFYAGLFVLPFVLVLSVTGAIYLFKPQIERWEERAWLGLGTEGTVSPDRQLAAAMAANPGARFVHYRLPRAAGDAAMVQLALRDGALRQVFVSPQGRVLASLDPDARIAAVAGEIHGRLLIGRWGDWLVELAASWTIVMILTGLYLWWPRPLRLAGTLWPRLHLRGRPLLRDLHRVTGFWIAGLVLVMLASGLPWAGVWGGALAWVRAEMGWVKGAPTWKIGTGGDHAGHQTGAAVPVRSVAPRSGLPLAAFVAKAEAERMAFPVLVVPPGPATDYAWTVRSATQNRPLARKVTYDPMTGAVIARSGFADQHPIDRIVNTGVAWHEGHLFGVANQIVGLLTAIALIGLSVVGLLMWLRRRPAGRLGAPPQSALPLGWVTVAVLAIGLLLPLFGASVLAILALDRLVRRIRTPAEYG